MKTVKFAELLAMAPGCSSCAIKAFNYEVEILLLSNWELLAIPSDVEITVNTDDRYQQRPFVLKVFLFLSNKLPAMGVLQQYQSSKLRF